eukprot:1044839-Prymnesium_polylepis.1
MLAVGAGGGRGHLVRHGAARREATLRVVGGDGDVAGGVAGGELGPRRPHRQHALAPQRPAALRVRRVPLRQVAKPLVCSLHERRPPERLAIEADEDRELVGRETEREQAAGRGEGGRAARGRRSSGCSILPRAAQKRH